MKKMNIMRRSRHTWEEEIMTRLGGGEPVTRRLKVGQNATSSKEDELNEQF